MCNHVDETIGWVQFEKRFDELVNGLDDDHFPPAWLLGHPHCAQEDMRSGEDRRVESTAMIFSCLEMLDGSTASLQ